MALLTIEGFDQYATDEDQMLDGNWAQILRTQMTQDAAKVRTGTTALLMQEDDDRRARRVIPVSATTAIGHWANRLTSRLPVVEWEMPLFSWRDANNEPKIVVWVKTDGRLRVTDTDDRSPVNIDVQSLNPVILVGAYQSIECKCVVDAVGGSFEVRIDGVTVTWDGASSGINTDRTGTGDMTQYQFGGDNPTPTGANGPEFTIDDIFIMDNTGAQNNDFIGDRQAFLLLPDGDDATQDWSFTGAASAWEAISEIPADDDTSYIEATAVNDVSEFTLEDIASNIANIAGVQMTHVARKLDAGAAQLQGSLISNAAVATGADRPITENYTHWNDVIELDPDGGVPWTPTKWNATTYRIEKTA